MQMKLSLTESARTGRSPHLWMADRTKGCALDVMPDAVCIHSQLRPSHYSDLKTTFSVVQIGKELFQNLKCDELSLLLTILRVGNL